MSDSGLSPEVAGELNRISRQLADEVLAEAATVSADTTAPVSGEAVRQARKAMTAAGTGGVDDGQPQLRHDRDRQPRATGFSYPVALASVITLAAIYVGFTVFPAHLDRVAAVASLLGVCVLGFALAMLRGRAEVNAYRGLVTGGASAPADAGIADAGIAADENWEMPPLDPAAAVDLTMDGFTELRCHGVSGPLPASVLGFPEEMVTEVDGNAYSGFWRRWMLSPETDVPQRCRREAFCWGGLTSRASTQALWLLLLPFSLVNLAHWMVLPYARDRGIESSPGRLSCCFVSLRCRSPAHCCSRGPRSPWISAPGSAARQQAAGRSFSRSAS